MLTELAEFQKSPPGRDSLLNIKPIFTITDGEVHFAALTRNKEQTIKWAFGMMKKQVGTRPIHVSVAHADVLEEGKRLKERIAAAFTCVELWLTDFSAIMGYATSTGVLAIALL